MNKKRNLVLFIATSLDGYIATQEESLDWLFHVEGEGDNGYSDFYETVDAVLLGKKTYDWITRHVTGEFPYKDKECYVFTRSAIPNNEDVMFINDDLVSFTNNLKEREGKNIWLVGGGELVHAFMKEGLIDELRITVAPTLIGKGIPLFREGNYFLEYSLLGTRIFNQFVELHYKLKK